VHRDETALDSIGHVSLAIALVPIPRAGERLLRDDSCPETEVHGDLSQRETGAIGHEEQPMHRPGCAADR